ncbi:MAG TPA: LPS export ABC transporter periplasmic protein LptC [Longimicrobiales bacterium]|nr:LPS export ABC transporter periplasmic protein LptC [Longimicrobiales bacterium]
MTTRRGLALIFLTLSAACGAPSTPTGEDFQEIPADMIMIGMTEYMTASGLRRARLEGDTAFVFDDSAKVKIHGVKLTIFNEQGAEAAHLTSKTGDFNTTNQGMVARGSVVLVTVGERPARIETEELHYDPESHRIWSTVTTTMIEGGSRIVGDGFTADDKFENKSVTRPRGRVEGQRIRF